MEPLISVITASFNKKKYIKDTVMSVICQTYSNWELIIIDDRSNDGTLEIIEELKQSDVRIKLFVNDINRGANYSRNVGIKEAQGTYIIFLDADDLLQANCLENRLTSIAKGSFDFCVFSMGVFTHKIGDSSYKWIPRSSHPLADFLKHDLPWSILQPIWKKDFLIKINGFDESFQRLQDVDLHTRALMEPNVSFALEPNIVDSYYRIDEERKNFNVYTFLERRILSSNLYCTKFHERLSNNTQKKYLFVTIYKTYLQLLYQYQLKTISSKQFTELKSELFSIKSPSLSYIHKFLFSIGYVFSRLPFRVPGVNWLICKLIII